MPFATLSGLDPRKFLSHIRGSAQASKLKNPPMGPSQLTISLEEEEPPHLPPVFSLSLTQSYLYLGIIWTKKFSKASKNRIRISPKIDLRSFYEHKMSRLLEFFWGGRGDVLL